MIKLLNIIWPETNFNINQETAVKCFLHDDNRPSMHINYQSETKILHHCKVCDIGGSTIIQLLGLYYGSDSYNTHHLFTSLNEAEFIDEFNDKIINLQNTPQSKKLLTKYGVTDKIIQKLNLMCIGNGISFPITVDNLVVDIRTYNPNNPIKIMGMPNTKTGFLFPQFIFEKSQNIVLTEGEKDCAVLLSHNINAATITGGAQKLPDKTPIWLENKNIYIAYDNDEAGEKGKFKLAKYLLSLNLQIKVYNINLKKLTQNKPKGDITDYFNEFKGTTEQFQQILLQAPEITKQNIPHKINTKKPNITPELFENADKYIGKWLESTIQITATFESSFTFPTQIAEINNQLRTFTITDSNIEHCLHLIDSKSDTNIKSFFPKEETGNPPSEFKISKRRTIFKINIASINNKSTEKNTEHIGYVLDKQLQSGKIYKIIYKIIANKFNGNLSTPIIINAIDISDQTFINTIKDKTKIALTNINKVSYNELIQNTKAHINSNFNNKLLEILEITYHSPLEFNLGKFKKVKGTINSIAITDTGFGKSISAQKILEYYKLGERVSLAGTASTPTGLLGGSKMVGKTYQTTAGVIPRNHKGIVIFEELSKNNDTIMKNLTDVRTSGIVEIARVSGKISLPANIRMVFFSNPKSTTDGTNKTVDSYPNGIEIVQDLLGTKEDIGRFDLITVLGRRESTITTPLWETKPTINQNDAIEKLKWVWSRTAEQIHISKQTIEYLINIQSEYLNNLFQSDLQIFGRKTYTKLAKVAIAIAGFMASHTKDFTSILVTKRHIDLAVDLFIRLYKNETFKLDKFTKEERSYAIPDKGATSALTRIYQKNNQIIDQLDLNSEIQTTELKTVSNLDTDDFTTIISELTKFKLIRNIKSKIQPTEKFRKTIENVKQNYIPEYPETAEEELMKKT